MTEQIRIKRKVVLVGDPMVGKTSLVRKYVTDQFSDDYIMTVGFKVTSKKLVYKDTTNNTETELTLMIWDIMGQKQYKLTPITAFQGAKGAIMVCDRTRPETLFNLTNQISWLFNVTTDIPLIILANKSDLTDQIKFGESALKDIGTAFRAPYFTTSAKTGGNVQLAFNVIGRMILKEQGI